MPEEVDVAVVGAGPAGLVAAAVAAGAGAKALLMERQAQAGGRLGIQHHPLQGPASMFRGLNGVELCRRLLAEAMADGVEVSLNTSVSGLRLAWANPPLFGLSCANAQGQRSVFTARAVVLATGSLEPWMEFPGSTLAGVMLSGDAQAMVNVQGVLPGRRALMVGGDNAGLLIAAALLASRVEVAALIDQAPQLPGRLLNAAPLREAGVPLLTSTKILAAHGESAVESVTIARVESWGAPVPGTERTLHVDTICLAGPRVPESGLAAQVGCPLHEVEGLGGLVPVHGRRMATPLSRLYTCGDAAGVESGAVALESGRLAGLWAAADLGYVHPQGEAYERLASARLGYLRRGPRGALRRAAKAALASELGRIECAMRAASG